MIITAIMDMIYWLLDKLLVFDLPSLPSTVVTLANQVVGYITTGFDVLRCFVGNTAMSVLGVCLALVIAMNIAMTVYHLVFWVLRKVPVASVRE